MERLIKPARLVFMFLMIAVLVVIYLITLYRLQIIDGAAAYEESQNARVSKETVLAARGSILDRYGRTLVTNRNCNNLLINADELFDRTERTTEQANEIILQVCNMVAEYGDEHIDELPITDDAPFEFTPMTSVQRERLNAWIDAKAQEGYDVSHESSAVEILAAMRARYGIDNNYSARDARTIAGVRYEINVRYNINTSDYIFAEDVSMELITHLLESNFPGFEVETSYVREYNTNYAAHILGYTNVMSDEEYKYYSKKGYPLNTRVGKDGAEYVFEDYLHGVNGTARVTRTAAGIVTGTVYTEEPQPGNNVYLTIDIGLQEAAENALNSFITNTNLERVKANEEVEMYGASEDGHDEIQEFITGGAVVAVDVATGEPLAIASWPTYDASRIIQDWAEISTAENDPLFNRALNGIYAPGSTFKPVTAMAGLCEHKIDTLTTIECEGIFDKYAEAGYAPRCWIYGQGLHGELTLSEAITLSCNYYFYTVADYLQISLLAKYAKAYGLGEPTGIELPENVGRMSTDQYTQEQFGRDMYAGDTLQAGIGQSFSEFNTLQMAEYCAALANNGYRHGASLLKSVRSFDYSETIYERTPEVLSSVEADPSYYEVIHQGMHGVVTDPMAGSVALVFADAPYSAAAKTGTAQRGEDRANNGFFICYAPFEDPQIAVAVAVEKVGAGATTAEIARQVLDYYFSFVDSTVALEGENQLLR